MPILIPVLLSFVLGPGVGQLYNKEFKKGTYLLVLSFIVFIAAVVWCFKATQPYLPPDLATVDPATLQTLLKNAATEVSKTHSRTLGSYEFILTALWIYGVVDAARGGMKRASGQTK